MAKPVANTDYDDADIVRSCTRKKGYPSEEIARLSISSIREVNPSAELRAYGCRHCGRWHIGRNPSSRPLDLTDAPSQASRHLKYRVDRTEPVEEHDREDRLRKNRLRRRDED